MYPVDPITEMKRIVTAPVYKFLDKARHFWADAKNVPAEMADNLIAEAQRPQNLKWRTQKEISPTTSTEQWDAKLQLYGLKRLLRHGKIELFVKRLIDYGWTNPFDLALLVGRRNGVLLPSTVPHQKEWWAWYERIYRNAAKKDGIAGWNEVFRYLEQEIFNPFKK